MKFLLALLIALPNSACALHCHNTRTHLLTWYEYVRSATDTPADYEAPDPNNPDDKPRHYRTINRIKSEDDPTLSVGDYVLTDGEIYLVTDQTWDEIPNCSHFYRHNRDPRK